MFQCTACQKFYKSKQSLQAHQRSRCKTFVKRKPKLHLDKYFTECLLYFPAVICDVIHQYLHTIRQVIITWKEHINHFLQIMQWFKMKKSEINLISLQPTLNHLQSITTFLSSRNWKHPGLTKWQTSFQVHQPCNDPWTKETFLSNLIHLNDILLLIKNKYGQYFHCMLVIQWCNNLISNLDQYYLIQKKN